MKLEINMDKDNFVKTIKLNGKSIGHGLTRMIIDLEAGRGKVLAFMVPETVDTIVSKEVMKNDNIQKLVERK